MSIKAIRDNPNNNTTATTTAATMYQPALELALALALALAVNWGLELKEDAVACCGALTPHDCDMPLMEASCAFVTLMLWFCRHVGQP